MRINLAVTISDESLKKIKKYLNTNSDDVVAVFLAETYQEGSTGFFEECVELDEAPIVWLVS